MMNTHAPSYDAQNPFARILRGELACKKVYEDAHMLAFEDLHPQAPVHVLLIPKGAYVHGSAFYTYAPSAEVEGFFRGVGAVIAQLGVHKGGYRLITNEGAHGGQEVPHFHLHLLAGCPLGPLVSL